MSANPIPVSGELADELHRLCGAERVISDQEELAFYSSDVYGPGEALASLVVKPKTTEDVSSIVSAITGAGYAIVTRGGGMSYTGGYVPMVSNTVVVDVSDLNRILSIDETDMVMTVEAGVTWKQIYDVLKPLGLRLPFYGTFSGSKATVGGGAANGALFMGTGRYGTITDIILGLEVVTAQGEIIVTGQSGFNQGRPYYRNYGPDLTGLFTHDAGVLGIKTKISLRLIRPPSHIDFLSFVFPDALKTAKALSAVARLSVVEEAYVFDPLSTKNSLANADLKQDFRRLLGVIKGQSSFAKGLRDGAKLVVAGRNFMDEGLYSLHMVCSNTSEAGLNDDLSLCRQTVEGLDGAEIANSIPKAARANPFEPLNGILGAQGERWAALNAKVAHSDAEQLIQGTLAIFEKYQQQMQEHGVFWTHLMIAISNHVFSFEPVLRWFDEWLPVHRRTPEPSHLKKLTEPAANPAGRALVDTIRSEVVSFFARVGAASTQIGKTYEYFDNMNPATAKLLMAIKKDVDPKGLMNPGALKLPKP